MPPRSSAGFSLLQLEPFQGCKEEKKGLFGIRKSDPNLLSNIYYLICNFVAHFQ